MSKIRNPLPSPPPGVRYALTVPQSVMFAELSLDGSRRWAFSEAMHIDYEPSYIAIDNGAMSWNYDSDPGFEKALESHTSPTLALARFIATMEATARGLDRASRILTPSANRLPGSLSHLIEDLTAYWRAYALHMTSLFTFWNAEYILSSSLTHRLQEIGKRDELRSGLARFLKPAEENYFALERQHLRRLTSRFSLDKTTYSDLSVPARNALRTHIALFGFLLAPFNLGESPTAKDLMSRVAEVQSSQPDLSPKRVPTNTFDDLPPEVRILGLLAQRLTFWKTERIDVMSLADARAQPLFDEAADLLRITPQQLFAMARGEITASLIQNRLTVPVSLLEERLNRFCIALVDGEISFYRPSDPKDVDNSSTLSQGSVLHGVAASPGVASGAARVIVQPEDVSALLPGEVLVTRMTRPEMGAALDRAAAFVTDEGGLMCHAAIIAREMKKPCVIGVGNATVRIAPGSDLIVDGNKGEVEIGDQPLTK